MKKEIAKDENSDIYGLAWSGLVHEMKHPFVLQPFNNFRYEDIGLRVIKVEKNDDEKEVG